MTAGKHISQKRESAYLHIRLAIHVRIRCPCCSHELSLETFEKLRLKSDDQPLMLFIYDMVSVHALDARHHIALNATDDLLLQLGDHC